MDAVRSGMPLRAIRRVIASCGRTTETAESMATWGGWFRVKYFAICAPWALAACDRVVMDASGRPRHCGRESRAKLPAVVPIPDAVHPEFYTWQVLAGDLLPSSRIHVSLYCFQTSPEKAPNC